MSDSNVAERLKTFIEMKGLSYSQFADTCGIPRPSLSQFLTGRNKKMSDLMVGQIHNMFPELSIVWLLFGEGPIENWREGLKSENNITMGSIFENESIEEEKPRNSESKKIVFSHEESRRDEISKSRELKNYIEESQLSELKIEKLQSKIKELQSQIENLKKNPRKVNHITVYYDDSTFETFYPK